MPPPKEKDVESANPKPNLKRHPSRLLTVAALVVVVVALYYYLLLRPLTSYIFNPGLGPTNHERELRKREQHFLSIPTTDSALAASRAYATHPHLAGSPEDLQDAKSILTFFQSELGIITPPSLSSELPIFPAGSPQSRNATLHLTDRGNSSNKSPRPPSAWIDVYYPVLNTPLDRSLQIVGKDGKALWSADLVEDGDPVDEEAHRYKDHVPTWHGLSRGGEAQGQLVYVNYGTKEDYDELVASGTNFTGKIVIARYGSIFRGLKIKRAEELGAVGALIYSDPRDDGFVTVENGFAPYPAGPARNPTSVQRGSVQYLSFYPGDPTTPGYPSYEDAERTEGTNIPKVPSLPISWRNAERLLEEIEETYVIGEDGQRRLSGKASLSHIKLVNHVDTKVTPIWNVMAAIPGHVRNEVVVIGCHRDAWVMGAADPTSGTVSLHEVVKGLGALLRSGWRPLRNVIIASWDAEEYGLVGSTEWGEDFADWISEHVDAYINVDVSVSGSRWNVGGSPSLAHLIKQSALKVPHPTAGGKTLWDAREDQGPFSEMQNGNTNGSLMVVDTEFWKAYRVQEEERIERASLGVSPLGSGSDYTVFLQRLGVASTDEGFGFTPTDAVYHYHSIYDSQRWQEVYGDPGFHRHVAVAKHLGVMALRLIDSIILPINVTHYAHELDRYLDRVQAEASDAGVDAPDMTGLRKAIKKVQGVTVELDKEGKAAEKHLLEVFDEIFKRKRLVRIVKRVFGLGFWFEREDDEGRVEEYLERAMNGDDDEIFRKLVKAAKRVAGVNRKIKLFERGFIEEGGIRGREWYRHLGVAPGKWLGYGATTFPALTEALVEDKDEKRGIEEVERLRKVVDMLAEDVRP